VLTSSSPVLVSGHSSATGHTANPPLNCTSAWLGARTVPVDDVSDP